MKHIVFHSLAYIPASHESVDDPGVLKKVLAQRGHIQSGSMQMINWAKLLPHKSFKKHFHEDMQEVFIMMHGSAVLTVNEIPTLMSEGDMVIVEPTEFHEMVNETDEPVYYLAFGIAPDTKGKTVNA